MIINKGATNNIVLSLREYFDEQACYQAIAIEIILGDNPKTQIKKRWYKNDKIASTMLLDRSSYNINFDIIPPCEWNYQIPVQIRVKKRDNAIECSNIFYAYINSALSTEDF